MTVYRENIKAIEAVKEQGRITIMGVGNSMTPLLKSKQMVVVERVDDHSTLKKNDIVLVRVGRSIYLHKITNIFKHANALRFEISNNHGHVNGIVSEDNIHGLVVEKL